MTLRLGLSPRRVFDGFALWQPFTYMFLHGTGGFGHMLFNMLALWMFGTELERTWGTRFFTKYYLITGVGAAATSLLLSLFSTTSTTRSPSARRAPSTACCWRTAMYFPHRTIYLYFIFPIPARIFVMIVGAIAFLSSIGGPGGGVAHTAHLGGLRRRLSVSRRACAARPLDELKYRYLHWKMGRARSKFDVYSGGTSVRRRLEERVEETHSLESKLKVESSKLESFRARVSAFSCSDVTAATGVHETSAPGGSPRIDATMLAGNEPRARRCTASTMLL